MMKFKTKPIFVCGDTVPTQFYTMNDVPFDFHTAEACEPRACVIVFTVDDNGEQDEEVAVFYPVGNDNQTHVPLYKAEERAIAFMNLIADKED